MFDLNYIRKNPQDFDAGLARRGLDGESASILAEDEKRRALQTQLQSVQEQRNAKSKDIGLAKREKREEDAARLMQEVAALKDQMAALEEQERTVSEALTDMLSRIPNIPDANVPQGNDEDDNVEIRRHGDPRQENDLKDHVDLGEALGLIDFEGAANLSGARFVVLKGALARMERALGQFMLDLHISEFDYTEASVPFLVRDNALYGTGQLPKFAEDLFKTDTDHWLIPTAEVPVTNLAGNQIMDEESLPLRYTALTPCFRSEAGSAGRDTRGMLRQHQFWKVELVSITTPEQSAAEHERLTAAAEEVLKRLNLPYRTVTLCTGDLGFSAHKTYDIEVWMPGQNRYREISSCSIFGDFQARRMKARCRSKGEKQTRFVHTLNGSGVAVGRALIAVMENYQNADGSITVPDALQPYMGGLTKIVKAF